MSQRRTGSRDIAAGGSSDIPGILDFLRAAEGLKTAARSGWTSAGQPESVAEHTWRLCLMALVMHPTFPDVDFGRLIRICIIHDLGEAIGGDVPAPEQARRAAGKAADERRDLLALLAPLPAPVRDEITSLWDEYEAAHTPEAKLAKALDKLETILQHTQGANPVDFDYRFNLGYGRRFTADHPVLTQVRAMLDEETERRARESDARQRLSSGKASWVQTYFGPDYLDSVQGILSPERTAEEASFILSETGLEPPARVLDLGCGHGRHVIELARRGFDVTGMDLNVRSLPIAGAAGLRATLVNGDYRSPPDGPFDLVLSLFGSFGFGSDDDNARTLATWCDRIADGGWIMLELWHRDLVVSAFEPRRSWHPHDQLQVDESRTFDPLSGRLQVHYDYIYSDGRRSEHDIDVRLYTAAEIRSMLAPAGVRVAGLFGSARGGSYTTTSRYMAILGRKHASPV
jgi:putative hydrolase of HD superfamily